MITPIKTINKYSFAHFDTEQVKAIIRNRMMVVTLDHDDIDLNIPLEKVAGRVLSFSEKDGEFLCEWEPNGTKSGKEAKKLGKKGTIRPIGLGSLKDGVVQDDYKLLHVVIQK